MIMIEANITPCKCNNPNHPRECPMGSMLVECEESEAHRWLARISIDNEILWGSNQSESGSREAAEKALLKRLADGITIRARYT